MHEFAPANRTDGEIARLVKTVVTRDRSPDQYGERRGRRYPRAVQFLQLRLTEGSPLCCSTRRTESEAN